MTSATSIRKPLTLILAAIPGVVLLLYATATFGVGVSRDSVVYLDGARNLALNNGFTTALTGTVERITHWPVLYPAFIAPLYALDADVVHSLRYVNIVLFMLYLAAVDLLILVETRGSVIVALGASLFAGCSIYVLQIYARAWSETVFLVFFLFGMLFLGLYLERPRWHVLVVSAGLIALAWLSRYAGAALLITGGLSILIWSPRSFWPRVRDTLVFGVIVALPMAVQMAYNYRVTTYVANRSIGFVPIPPSWWRSLYVTISGWIVPASAPEAVRLPSFVLVAAMVLISIIFWQRTTRHHSADTAHQRVWVYPTTMLFFSAIYLLFIVLATVEADSAIPADPRMFSPVFSALIVVFAYTAHWWLAQVQRHHYVLIVMSVLLFVGFMTSLEGVRSVVWAVISHEKGIEYNSGDYWGSDVIVAADHLPAGTVFFSNNPQFAFYLLNRNTKPVDSGQCDASCTSFASELERIAASSQRDAALLWVSSTGDVRCNTCVSSLAADVGFTLIEHDDKLSLYRVAAEN